MKFREDSEGVDFKRLAQAFREREVFRLTGPGLDVEVIGAFFGTSHVMGKWEGEVEFMPVRRAPWIGEGLPPVGTVCELWRPGYKGDHVEIVAHFKTNCEIVAAYVPVSGSRNVAQAIAGCFKPIRTPEQIEAEEREAEIAKIAQVIESPLSPIQARAAARRLYKAGARMPGEGKKS